EVLGERSQLGGSTDQTVHGGKRVELRHQSISISGHNFFTQRVRSFSWRVALGAGDRGAAGRCGGDSSPDTRAMQKSARGGAPVSTFADPLGTDRSMH